MSAHRTDPSIAEHDSYNADPYSLAAHLQLYLEAIELKNFAEPTMKTRRFILGKLLNWCHERSLYHSTEITKPILDRYRRYLYDYRQENGRPLRFVTQHSRLSAIRAFFAFLARENLILYNPASELDLPKVEERLPMVLTVKEVEKVLAEVDLDSRFGIRDRAIIETLYSTGVRASELCRLELGHLDHDRGTVWIKQGKGRKDRIIPIGQRALLWVDKYLSDARDDQLSDIYEMALFLSKYGRGFTVSGLGKVTSRYVRAIGKPGSCHVFRHSMATHMLEGGADIRYVQQMLGHGDLRSTETYTHVSIRKLKEIHAATHPAKLRNQPSST